MAVPSAGQEPLEVKPKPRSGAFSLGVSLATKSKVECEKCLVIGDIHAPFHDEKAVGVALALSKHIKPDVIVFNGDILDALAVSRFNKDPKRALMLQEELDATCDVLTAFRRANPKAKMVFIEGNHEARLQSYLQSKSPELHGLRALDIEGLLGLKELGIKYIKSRGRSAYWRYGAITIGHFDRVSKHSANTEKLLMDDRNESLIQGHTHRGGVYYKTLPNGTVMAGIGGFCLCDTSPDYCTDPNWQQGVVIVTKRKSSNRFFIEPVPIVDHEALYEGYLFSG